MNRVIFLLSVKRREDDDDDDGPQNGFTLQISHPEKNSFEKVEEMKNVQRGGKEIAQVDEGTGKKNCGATLIQLGYFSVYQRWQAAKISYSSVAMTQKDSNLEKLLCKFLLKRMTY